MYKNVRVSQVNVAKGFERNSFDGLRTVIRHELCKRIVLISDNKRLQQKPEISREYTIFWIHDLETYSTQNLRENTGNHSCKQSAAK